MNHRRTSKKRVTMAIGAVAAVVAAGVTFQTANASQEEPSFTVRTLSASAAGNLASTLGKDVGGDAAGAYYDAKAKALVMNVVDAAAADAVRKAGGKARIVENSFAELKSARQTLTDRATIPGEATVGMKVSRSGSTSQVHEGQVTGLDATVNYGDGRIVNGLSQTTVCAEPGDSGGALFAGDTAVGLTSGGSGDCSAGGETFFQPVPEALEAFGAEIG
ncbi:S1 family peptidase [Streptomyces sp. NPDC059175]|uniref:S1 family peptidase n=1 Tax=Streptomyces sp. NPDC059175 TaxID=3346757 RepID=UPI0036B09D06